MDQIAWVAIVSRTHTWFGRRLDEKVDWSDGREIVTHANVPMRELDATRA
jgi:uncharacterized RmlC-like cupin family protein